MARPQTISDSEIAGAAREVFLANGAKTAVAQIADRLGVSAAALFQRVGSKAQLMMLALAPELPPTMVNLAAGLAPDRPISEQLHEHLFELLTFLQSVIPSLIVLRAAGLFPPPKRKARATNPGAKARPPTPQELRHLLGAWLTDAKHQGRIEVKNPRVCAEALLGAMEARCFNAHLGGSDYVRGDDRTFLTELIDGLTTEPGRPSLAAPPTLVPKVSRSKKRCRYPKSLP